MDGAELATKKLPIFSIVIPNYNSGSILERAIKSLVSQGYPRLQLIVVDGGSEDCSKEIIKRYEENFDVLISERDKGQADALNKGFSYARGDIFGWLCADDELLPGTLHYVAKLFLNKPYVDVITGGCERVFQDGTRIITKPFSDTWRRIRIQNVIEQPSTFWKAELHRKLGELDLSYYLGFDWDFWIRMRNAGAKILTTERVLSRYYFSDSNKCGVAGNQFAEEAFRLIRKYGPLFGGLAHAYRLLYYHFDLKGCMDDPPTCSRIRYKFYRVIRALLRLTMGQRLLNSYNWHFASCQARGLKWY